MLKCSPEDALDDPSCPQVIFFQNRGKGCRGPQFFLLGQKWFSGRCEAGILSPPIGPDLGELWSHKFVV